ncbi:MAG TPA: hypothetical protein VN783_07165 [Thermoanaerobaculia bacterium]|nr:hypothetical protein [Thermoanaerobaculia bacterium]
MRALLPPLSGSDDLWPQRAPEPSPDDFSLDTAALLERLNRVEAVLTRERRELPDLLAEILRALPETWRPAIAADPRFHSFCLSEALVLRSESVGEGNPATAGELAALALEIAGHLDPVRHAPALVEDLKARAWAALGESRRRSGDAAGAERALREGVQHLLLGTGDLLVEARLLEFEADLRFDEGYPTEADSLLRQAASRLRQARETHLLARLNAKRRDIAERMPADHPFFRIIPRSRF